MQFQAMQFQTRMYTGCKYLMLAISLSLALTACSSGGGNGGGGATTPLVVYHANQDTANVFELYRSDTGVKLNPSLVSGGSISSFALTPDKQSIVYSADQDTNNVNELYRVDLANPGVSTKLNAAMVPGGDVRRFSISPDGRQVVYDADADINNVSEVYLVNLDGTNHHKINGSVGSPPKVEGLLSSRTSPWSADGRFIVQNIRSLTTFRFFALNVHDTTLGVPNSTRLTPSLVAGGNVTNFEITPDSKTVVYRADQTRDNIFELYRVSFDTPANSVRLNPALITDRHVFFNFAITPDSKTVVYRARQDTNNVAELYRVELGNPGASTKLNAALIAGGNVDRFAISPDGSKVVYDADKDINNVSEVYLVNINATNHQKINGPVGSPAKVGVSLPSETSPWSADGRFVVQNVFNLTTFRTEGLDVHDTTLGTTSKSTRLTPGSLISHGRVVDFVIAPDSKAVVYRADQDTSGVLELFRVAFAAPSVSTKLNGVLVSGGQVNDFDVID